MLELVKPEHRINSEQLVEHLNKLLRIENRVEEPTDEIKSIFEKITAWKKKYGNQDNMDEWVGQKLKNKQQLKIHNITTILEKFEEIKD